MLAISSSMSQASLWTTDLSTFLAAARVSMVRTTLGVESASCMARDLEYFSSGGKEWGARGSIGLEIHKRSDSLRLSTRRSTNSEFRSIISE